MRVNSILFIFLYIACIATPAFAISSVNKQWSFYSLEGNYGKVVYNVQPQLRLEAGTRNAFEQSLNNFGFGYAVDKHLQVWIGQTFTTVSQDAVGQSAHEYRFWQQVFWQQKFSKLSIATRLRMEERKSYNFTEWNFRIRNRFIVNVPLTDLLTLELFDEVFFKLNDVPWIFANKFDQNRAYAGLARELKENLFFGFGLIYQNIYGISNTQGNYVYNLYLRTVFPG